MSGALAEGCQQWVHVCFGVKPALGLPVATGERAVAISLVNIVSVSWSGAGLGVQLVVFIVARLLYVKQRINSGRAKKAPTPAESVRSRDTRHLFFVPSLLPSFV